VFIAYVINAVGNGILTGSTPLVAIPNGIVSGAVCLPVVYDPYGSTPTFQRKVAKYQFFKDWRVYLGKRNNSGGENEIEEAQIEEAQKALLYSASALQSILEEEIAERKHLQRTLTLKDNAKDYRLKNKDWLYRGVSKVVEELSKETPLEVTPDQLLSSVDSTVKIPENAPELLTKKCDRYLATRQAFFETYVLSHQDEALMNETVLLECQVYNPTVGAPQMSFKLLGGDRARLQHAMDVVMADDACKHLFYMNMDPKIHIQPILRKGGLVFPLKPVADWGPAYQEDAAQNQAIEMLLAKLVKALRAQGLNVVYEGGSEKMIVKEVETAPWKLKRNVKKETPAEGEAELEISGKGDDDFIPGILICAKTF